MKYVMYNPVRAGLVSQARDYAWSWCAPDLDAGTGPAAGSAPGDPAVVAGIVVAASATADAFGSGTGPGGWWLRRVAQVGAGKVFGSAGFVLRTAAALGDRFRARGVGAHPVGEIGFSTHGWRLAKAGA